MADRKLTFVALVIAWLCAADCQATPPEREAVELCQASEKSCREGRCREALTQADRALRAAPDFALAYAMRARARFFLGDEHGALADCNEAVRRDPTLGLGYAYRAPLAWLRGAPAAGVADGEQAMKSLPNSATAWTCAALAKLYAHDPSAAIALAAHGIQLDANDPEAYRVRGLSHAALGEIDHVGAQQLNEKARLDFDAAVRVSSNQPFYLAARANYLIGRAAMVDAVAADPLLAQAATDARNAVKADPECARALVAEANVLAAQERRHDVLISCTKAIAANPRLVAAYLRAADELSPRDASLYRLHQDALAEQLDLREFKGGDFAFGALLADLQRIATNRMKRPVIVYINFNSFAEEQRSTLRDAKINLNTLMDVSGENLLKQVTFKTILDHLCWQVGATFFANPEYIEIVSRDTAKREAARQSRLMSYDLIAPIELYRREDRVLLFEQALQQSIDLRQLKGGDFALGALLTDIQRLASNRMKREVPLYINYNSFPAEERSILRDSKVNMNVLMNASGENLLPSVKVATILDQMLRCNWDDVKARVTPDYIEIVRTGTSTARPEVGATSSGPGLALSKFGQKKNVESQPENYSAAGSLRLQGKPRPEAVEWLTRGIEMVPESARLYLARGQVYLEQYELDAAIADFSRAIERNPADPQAYRLRSIAYSARGKPADAALARADALATRP